MAFMVCLLWETSLHLERSLTPSWSLPAAAIFLDSVQVSVLLLPVVVVLLVCAVNDAAAAAAAAAAGSCQDAGVLQLPRTLLAWEDEQTDPEPAMHLHRGMLPPNHERPDRLRVIITRLRAAGLLGELLLLLLLLSGSAWSCC
jgi:hypothetical protein